MKTNDKRTNTLANKRQAVFTALACEYKPEIDSDDLFNIEVDLGSAIARTDYRIKSLKDKLDAVERPEMTVPSVEYLTISPSENP